MNKITEEFKKKIQRNLYEADTYVACVANGTNGLGECVGRQQRRQEPKAPDAG